MGTLQPSSCSFKVQPTDFAQIAVAQRRTVESFKIFKEIGLDELSTPADPLLPLHFKLKNDSATAGLAESQLPHDFPLAGESIICPCPWRGSLRREPQRRLIIAAFGSAAISLQVGPNSGNRLVPSPKIAHVGINLPSRQLRRYLHMPEEP